MQLFGGGDEFAKKKDIANPNLAYGSIEIADGTKISGSTDDFTITASNDANWWYCKIPLNLSINKGDIITISAFATLSGTQATDGLYKAAIYSSSTSMLFDDTSETVFLKSGIRSSKTFVANQNSNPNDPPVLLVYCGTAGKTGGNTLHAQKIKVERGAVATPWCPAYEDYVMKSDQVLTTKNVIQALFSDELVNLVDDKFDMNNASPGIYRSWGKKPINTPSQCLPWAKYFVVPFVEGDPNNLFQIAIDTNANIFIRTRGGQPPLWNIWHTVNLG